MVRAELRESDATSPELWPSVGEYLIYYVMSNDHTRNRRYREAIDKLAPGKVVVDLGTGQDAIWARACVEAGATKVYAIEAKRDAFDKATAKVRALGLDNRIHVLHGLSDDVELPQRAGLCVSELIGMIRSAEGACTILRNAKRRFLSEKGITVPQRCTTRIAAATLPDDIHRDPCFNSLPMTYVEQVLRRVGHPFDFRLCVRNFPRSSLLSSHDSFEEIDFETDLPSDYRRPIALEIEKPRRLDGLILWVNLWCDRYGGGIDTLMEHTNWLPVIFPVFYPGVEVDAGDSIAALCETVLSDDGVHPDYRVRGVLKTRDREVSFEFESAHHGERFRANGLHRALCPEPEQRQWRSTRRAP